MPPKRHSNMMLMLLVSHAAIVVVVAVHSNTLRISLPLQQRSSSTVSLPFLSPSSLSLSASTRSMETPVISSLSTISAIRGGADAVAVDQDESESEDENESENDEENEDESEEEETESPKPSQGPPIKVFIRTNLNIPLLDQSLEFTASQKRDIASIKLSISRQMLGRPPASSQTLRLGDRVVQDDELISELLEEWEDEHDDDEDDDNDDETDPLDNDDDDTVLPFVLDIPPPIDPKFATELKSQLKDSNVNDLLDAYAFNMAMIHRNTEHIFQRQRLEEESAAVHDEEDDTEEEHVDDEDEEDDIEHSSTAATTLPESIQLRQQAQLLREQLVGTFHADVLQRLEQIQQEAALAKLKQEQNEEENEEDSITNGDVLLTPSLKSKHTGVYLGNGLVREFQDSQKGAIKGGATMNMKRALQRNLNINWPDTIRNTFLFLFFAKFGARSASTRLFLSSMAPLCFLIQFRPIKIMIKQIFYAIGKPPGILLSLLPAPQQTIMSLNVGLYMRNVYGEEEDYMRDLEQAEEEEMEGEEDDEHSEEEQSDEESDASDDFSDDESEEDLSEDDDDSDDE